VVESARRYKCRSVQSAQEYMMYLDTDGCGAVLIRSERYLCQIEKVSSARVMNDGKML